MGPISFFLDFAQRWLGSLPLLILTFLAALMVVLVITALWEFRAFLTRGGLTRELRGTRLGALSLLAGQEAPQLFCCWLILLGVFVVDATFTLLRRLVRGEKVYQAHRSDAYQHAAVDHGSHVRVSFAVAVINILWQLEGKLPKRKRLWLPHITFSRKFQLGFPS
jgi:Fuc2NAc and GlcNAc transferase